MESHCQTRTELNPFLLSLRALASRHYYVAEEKSRSTISRLSSNDQKNGHETWTIFLRAFSPFVDLPSPPKEGEQKQKEREGLNR